MRKFLFMSFFLLFTSFFFFNSAQQCFADGIQPKRDAAVEFAKTLSGLKNEDPKYADLIAPGESSEKQKLMSSLSGCALVAAGYLRNIGVDDPLLKPPYQFGMITANLLSLAEKHKALMLPSTKKGPQPGDIVIIGDDTSTGKCRGHYLILTESEPCSGGWCWTSVDGGQEYNDINTVRRKAFAEKRSLRVKSLMSPSDKEGCPVRGWINIEKLPIKNDSAETNAVKCVEKSSKEIIRKTSGTKKTECSG